MKMILLLTPLLAVGSVTAGAPRTAAAADGAALLEERCSVCHQSSRPKMAKKTKAEWEQTVSRMMGKGARLSAEEKQALVDHLAKTYKP